MRVFLDANLLFTAAHHPAGKAHWLITGVSSGNLRLLTCTLSVEEARRNLAVKAPPPALAELDRLLRKMEVLATPAHGFCPFPLAKKDQPLYWAAKAGKASHFLTGDIGDFGPLMNKPGKTGGIMIQTLQQFIETI